VTWFLYAVLCVDGSLYCGVTVDVPRRVEEHNGKGKRGARYTRSRRPVELVGSRPAGKTRGEAQRAEARFKRLSRAKKLKEIERWRNLDE
jgi:putative endonuclease